MANISITRRCRRHCSYCFAKHELNRSGMTDMPFETFKKVLAFLKRSHFPEARILGGEPTEHPLFRDFVTYARGEGFKILVFSGGLIPESALAYLADLPLSGFSMVLNAAHPETDSPELLRRQDEVCRALGRKMMLGVNINSCAQDPTYLLEWVERYDLRRTLRVGIAQPIWGGSNWSYRLRHPRPVSVLETFYQAAERVDIRVGFDCGFTPCMFSPAFLEAHADLFDASGLPPPAPPDAPVQEQAEPLEILEAVGIRCNPIVDILPEGDAIACYALSRACRLPMPEQGTREHLSAAFEKKLSSLLPAGCFRNCMSCPYREKGMCGGGCRARRALRLRPLSPSLAAPEPGGA
ncbi:MAG: radical SAM protein [Lentisphaerota bacterium]